MSCLGGGKSARKCLFLPGLGLPGRSFGGLRQLRGCAPAWLAKVTWGVSAQRGRNEGPFRSLFRQHPQTHYRPVSTSTTLS